MTSSCFIQIYMYYINFEVHLPLKIHIYYFQQINLQQSSWVKHWNLHMDGQQEMSILQMSQGILGILFS